MGDNSPQRGKKIFGEGWVGGFGKAAKRRLGNDEEDRKHGRTMGLGDIEVHEKDLDRGMTWRDGGW